MKGIRVIAFGTFDPLHDGHKYFLKNAKELGDFLLVVVARDVTIRAHKKREPFQLEDERLKVVAQLPFVNEVMLGNEQADLYSLLSEVEFDVVALGYDQAPSDDVVRFELDKRGKQYVKIVRIASFKPHQYKSTFIRSKQSL